MKRRNNTTGETTLDSAGERDETREAMTRRAFVTMLGMATLGIAGLAGCTSAGQSGSGDGEATGDARETSSRTSEDDARQAEDSAPAVAGSEVVDAGDAQAPSTTPAPTSTSLVLIYSRAGENYNVGYVDTGNTRVLADFVAAKTGADLFELLPAVPYPTDYQSCIDQALEEQHRGDRPAIAELPDLSPYSTIYFGFPVWWGDIPMPVYTAIESLDWSGKTIAPFNTHEGSGSAGMFTTLARVCEGATVLDGLTVQGTVAQNDRATAETRVDEWLSGLGL